METVINPWRSLNTRLVLSLVGALIIGMWSLSYVSSGLMRDQMQRLLGDQLLATVSGFAVTLNKDVDERFGAMRVAAGAAAKMIADGPAARTRLRDGLPLLLDLFNGGVALYGPDGVLIAGAPGRASIDGVHVFDQDSVTRALRQGQSTVGLPVFDPALDAPVFAMTVPIRGESGAIVGAMSGVTNLAAPNFLDWLIENGRSRAGTVRLISRQGRMLLVSSEPDEKATHLPHAGVNEGLDRFLQGEESTNLVTDESGEELLVSVRAIPAAQWFVATTMPAARVYVPVRDVLARIWLATLALTLLLGAITWWLVRRQLSPIAEAARSLAAVSAVDNGLPQLPVRKLDEVGRFIASFNGVMARLDTHARALRANEQFKSAVLNSITSSLAVLDRNGVVRSVNEAWRRSIVAVSAPTGIPAPWADVGGDYLACLRAESAIPAKERQQAIDGIAAVLGGRSTRYMTAYSFEWGTRTCWYSLVATPLDVGEDAAAVIKLTDISQAMRNEQELRISAVAFESNQCLLVHDAKRRILRVNKAFSRLTGMRQEDLQHPPWHRLIADRNPADTCSAIWSTVERTGEWRGELWGRASNGCEFLARCTVQSVENADNQVTHYVTTVEDVTGQQALEEQRLQQEMIHRAVLVREVHHRIKNNLQGIIGVLRRFAFLHPETADPIGQAIGQVQSISVVHGLQGRSMQSTVRLCELTTAIADQVSGIWEVPLNVRIPANWQPRVVAEKESVPIALILNELIQNAVKHSRTDSGGVNIALAEGARQGSARITIRNAGKPDRRGADMDRSGSGLALVQALMPRDGARMQLDRWGDDVVTLVDLDQPVIELEKVEEQAS